MKKNLNFIFTLGLLIATLQVNSQSWNVAGNSGTKPGRNFLGTQDSVAIVFKTSNTEAMRISKFGDVGIGINNPKGKLNIFSNDSVGIGRPGILTIGAAPGQRLTFDVDEIQALSSGSANALALNYSGGSVTAGNINVGGYNAFRANSLNNIAIFGESGENYALYGLSTPNGLGDGGGSSRGVYGVGNYGVYGETRNNAQYYAGYFVGDVLSTTGVYATSDEKLKQNISEFSKAISIINQLHPKQYEFRHDGNFKEMNLPQGKHFGLVAQDVEKILPELVKNSEYLVKDKAAEAMLTSKDRNAAISPVTSAKSEKIDFKALNYTELIPIMIKAIQEQQQEIEELKNIIAADKIANGSQQSGIYSQQSKAISFASLQQNIPNPFINSTTINYALTAGYSSAKIIITDKNGSTLKQINLSTKGSGSIKVDASTLAAGAYQYSLFVNDNLVDTKQMIISK